MVVNLFISCWPPPTTMDAFSATIVAGRGSQQIRLNIGRQYLINFYFNLLNLLNRFDGSLGRNMRKAVHPSSSVRSSNPHRQTGLVGPPPWWWCLICVCVVCCGLVWSSSLIVCRQVPKNNTKVGIGITK